MKLRIFIMGLALSVGAAFASAQEPASEEINASEVEEVNAEVSESTDQVAPAQLYALAQNVDDSELLRLYYKNNYKTSDQVLIDKAKTMRKIGWIGSGVLVGAGIITGIVLYSQDGFSGDPGTKWILYGCGGGIGAALIWGAAFNIYASSLQKKARQLSMYSAPIIEGDIMNFGANKLTAGVSVMGNQYTHTRGLGMSVKLNF